MWKPLQIDGWGLFSAVSKAAFALGAIKWSDAVAEAMKAVQCI
jgi:hypothetical protein